MKHHTKAPARRRLLIASLASLAVVTVAPLSFATTYEVGPGKPYASPKDVASSLQPGDVVLVSGDATYAGGIKLTKHGTAASKITIKGVRVNGKRPSSAAGRTPSRWRAIT